MNDPTLIGPCADYEHDLVELHDGALAPERARIVRLHVVECVRCRGWLGEFARQDVRLADTLPRVALSPDFEQRLRARIATVARPVARDELRSALVREHDSLLATVRRGARRRGVLAATATAAAAASVMLAGRGLLGRILDLLPALSDGPDRWIALGVVGVACAAATLAWSVGRSGLTLAP